jgi:hypothetical protein
MKIIPTVILLSLLIGCNIIKSTKHDDSKENLYKVFLFTSRSGGEYSCKDTLQKEDISNDTCWYVRYKHLNGKMDFEIKVKKANPSNGIINYKDDTSAYHYNFVDSKGYDIVKLSYANAWTDGEHDIYFCKNFGFIGMQSRAWHNWTEYKCLNDSINQIITCLQIQIYKDIEFHWDLIRDNNAVYKRVHTNLLTDKEMEELVKY